MFGPIEIFSKFCVIKFFRFSRFWKPNEIGMFVAQGLGGGNISKIVPIGPL